MEGPVEGTDLVLSNPWSGSFVPSGFERVMKSRSLLKSKALVKKKKSVIYDYSSCFILTVGRKFREYKMKMTY